ncbi:hypothetical protein LC061_13500 [Nitratireductor aquimarinus]|uniref:hypothetical protein n=1 Tax=Nitratireductor TaxID=245876 RepID=UPI001AEDF81F|nr:MULTISPECIES: hypothetical protein [Nitratireductor]MCA1261762.1 hypothetical protein [Nitratireductor aquimarinus]
MSIDKDLLDRLMEGRSPGDLFGKTGILSSATSRTSAALSPHWCAKWPSSKTSTNAWSIWSRN